MTDQEQSNEWADHAPAFISDPALRVRQATMADYPAVASFTADTWGDRSDYVPQAYPTWMDEEGDDQHTFVAVDTEAEPPAVENVEAADADAMGAASGEATGRAVGICQAVTLSEHEGWVQAMRIHPNYRTRGLAVALNDAAFYWLSRRDRSVARNMVYSWNTAGLAGSRASGFEPGAEFRWVRPEPDVDAGESELVPAVEDVPPGQQADAAWGFWQGSEARERLRGLSLDGGERWALSELTRAELGEAADDGRLQTVTSAVPVRGTGGGHGVRGFAYRLRTTEREDDDGEPETVAQYGVAAWADHDACDRLLAAVARDAADVGADGAQVLIPESVASVTDAAAAGVTVADNPTFVLHADLTREHWRR